jgi:hypothetical protein
LLSDHPTHTLPFLNDGCRGEIAVNGHVYAIHHLLYSGKDLSGVAISRNELACEHAVVAFTAKNGSR